MAASINPLVALGSPGGDMGQALGFQSGKTAPSPMGTPPPPQIDVSKGLPEEILRSAVKLRLEGSRRMMTRERLLQVVQFLGQVVFNGQFLAQINQQGKTVDFLEYGRMMDDALGIERTYTWMRDLTPQEEQKLAQPPPQVVAQQQTAQQESQTRMQIMQMKLQSDRYNTDTSARMKQLEIEEESAQEILKLLAKEKSDLLARQPDPHKAQEAAMNMQAKAQEMRQRAQEHMLNLHQQGQQGQMDMMQQLMQGRMDAQQQGQAHAQQMAQDAVTHGVGLQQSAEKHDQMIKAMKEKAAVSRVLGGPERRDRGSPS